MVNFGRVDVWLQSNMKSYLPYRFQLYPGLYTSHRGEYRLCQFSFERAIRSLEVCIEEAVLETTVKINSVAEIEEGRGAVVLGGGVSLSTRMKLIHAKYARYFGFYTILDSSNQITIKDTAFRFEFSADRGVISRYDSFLAGVIIQNKSMCETHYLCRERPCLLLLEQVTQPQQLSYPLVRIKEDRVFREKV